jgi:hypothetical protein
MRINGVIAMQIISEVVCFVDSFAEKNCFFYFKQILEPCISGRQNSTRIMISMDRRDIIADDKKTSTGGFLPTCHSLKIQ